MCAPIKTTRQIDRLVRIDCYLFDVQLDSAIKVLVVAVICGDVKSDILACRAVSFNKENIADVATANVWAHIHSVVFYRSNLAGAT